MNIGIAILYNMGTNIFLGEISYITKAISAVLQLGVTTDFAIFLYHSFMLEKKKEKDINSAMSSAISKTMVAVLGSSLTTIAGFLALCSMNLKLGKDIGIVMAKGVVFGVICVVTILPAMIGILGSTGDYSNNDKTVFGYNIIEFSKNQRNKINKIVKTLEANKITKNGMCV